MNSADTANIMQDEVLDRSSVTFCLTNRGSGEDPATLSDEALDRSGEAAFCTCFSRGPVRLSEDRSSTDLSDEPLDRSSFRVFCTGTTDGRPTVDDHD